MSTLTTDRTLDVSGTSRVPFGRLIAVELRKMADTRAGRWLLISIAALTALVLAIYLAVIISNDLRVDFRDFMVAMNTPMGILLPVLGIISLLALAFVVFALAFSRDAKALWGGGSFLRPRPRPAPG